MIGLQAIIFDFDGTISPTQLRQYKWFQFWAKENNKELEFSGLGDFMVFYNHHCNAQGVQRVYDELGLPCDMNNKNHPVWPAYERFKSENPAGFYPGMKEIILELAKDDKLKLALNTSNTLKSVKGDLEAEHILSCFRAFVGHETLAQYSTDGKTDALKKPSNFSLELTLKTIEANPLCTLHIGDTTHDLVGSQGVVTPYGSGNLITVGAAWGYEGREKLEKGAETPNGKVEFNYILDRPEQLAEVVKLLR